MLMTFYTAITTMGAPPLGSCATTNCRWKRQGCLPSRKSYFNLLDLTGWIVKKKVFPTAFLLTGASRGAAPARSFGFRRDKGPAFGYIQGLHSSGRRNRWCLPRGSDGTAHPVTRSFPVELSVERPDPRMADGMTARVRLPLSRAGRTVKVPAAWLAEQDGVMGVFEIKDGHALFRKVTLGGYYDQRVEIISGLQGGELIITNPAGVEPGDAVKY